MGNVTLLAGAASLPIVPPLGIDMLGFVNRTVSGQGYGQPMEAGAIVVECRGERTALLAVDMVLCPVETAEQIREKVASAIGCPKQAVLLNLNHSHALPEFPGDYKLGGEYAECTAEEYMFAEYVKSMVVSAARMAANRLEEAEMELGAARAEGISVNRRERTPEGNTKLGWNPEGICDDSVQTVCFRRPRDRSVIATAVNFACHPVIVGKNVPEYSSDYVGPLRDTVRRMLGGECIFLQGACGNILPLEAFCERKGKEIDFGMKVGMRAVESLMDPVDPAATVEKLDFGSVTPISLYRKQRKEISADEVVVSAAEAWVRFPLKSLPTREELTGELQRRLADMEALQGRPNARSLTNPMKYHADWARTMLRKLDEGSLSGHVDAPLQAIRIGNFAICAAPGEIFNEIGLAVKKNSMAKMTFYCGYSNGVLGYFPTAAEYPFGGYEPTVSHRGFSLPAPFAETCERLLTDTGSALVNRLFSTKES